MNNKVTGQSFFDDAFQMIRQEIFFTMEDGASRNRTQVTRIDSIAQSLMLRLPRN